ncbi:hypothetical protein [Pontibacillus chungwhensis]|nr:hypothetical protein [Pontibacillus chungwhensis]
MKKLTTVVAAILLTLGFGMFQGGFDLAGEEPDVAGLNDEEVVS